ncbi:MAG: hypothetical protein J7L34_03300, partial [Thermotogaceae bacterium]|nr:hypothetical protein [Thermotogaceae bacterium]
DLDPLTIKSYVDFCKETFGSLEKIRIGLGLHKVKDNPELFRKLFESAESENPDEIVIFSYKFINETNKNVILSFTKH